MTTGSPGLRAWLVWPAARLARRYRFRRGGLADRGWCARRAESDLGRSGRFPVAGEVVLIQDRGVVDASQAAVERPERRQQQGKGNAAVGDRPEEGPDR